ncbi:hypothetical protein EK21DRAFT_78421, partial [Setomelanomma holmii]
TMSPHHFTKRDAGSMPDFDLPKPVIVLLIMIGALLLVCMGYAVHHAWGFGTDGNGIEPLSVSQMEYMAEVRVRNMEHLEREGQWARGMGKRRDGEVVY